MVVTDMKPLCIKGAVSYFPLDVDASNSCFALVALQSINFSYRAYEPCSSCYSFSYRLISIQSIAMRADTQR